MSSGEVVRFSLRQRLEHVAVMTLFVALALTGFPQKFPDTAWARWLVDAMGGLGVARWLHRAAGLGFGALAALHLGSAVAGLITRRQALSLVPSRQDFRDVVQNLRYYVGLTEKKARFDRFDYREKFEYWGMVLGAVVMTFTGLVLYFPLLVTRVLPGELIPVAKVAHSNEGLLAFLVVITWHIYNAHLAPEVFPFDRSVFTGRISRERMEHEHPLELERSPQGTPERPEPP
ncbi:MAG TPA: cytochrome b/b6 domain-containing protein [Vicinamibacteria bacterium]|nr:cytochrome b/b6 domain-containing protein [Vicinamibacteria bacterium]